GQDHAAEGEGRHVAHEPAPAHHGGSGATGLPLVGPTPRWRRWQHAAHGDRRAASRPRREHTAMRWPEGFWWGTGASSAQTEGASPASDWWDWEQAGRVPISGAGNGFATRYAEAFALLAHLGLTHHRLSIDWARIEPEEGRRDEAAVQHYRAVLTAARDAGIEPWVTLHHFVLPRWVAERGGFLHEPNPTETPPPHA